MMAASDIDFRGITGELRGWYLEHGRALPWRTPPGVRQDPYKVWLSEIMLQQTTVKAVAPYYAAFLHRWPTVAALAAADLNAVLAAWAGLGYYARARNLHACARVVVERHGGRFPEREAELRALPGVGAYTSAAITAIAYDHPATPMDGNIERVVARLFAVETPFPKAKPELHRFATQLSPAEHAGDHVQAMMDLGATICTPKRPACALCPVRENCAAFRYGIAATLPVKVVKAKRPLRRGTAFVAIRGDGAVLLRRRAAKGLLGGMMEAPSSPWLEQPPDDPLSHAPLPAEWKRMRGSVGHTFTHFHLQLEVYRAVLTRKIEALDADQAWRWVMPEDLAADALPSLMRKVLVHALDKNSSPQRKPGSSDAFTVAFGSRASRGYDNKESQG